MKIKELMQQKNANKMLSEVPRIMQLLDQNDKMVKEWY